MSELWDAPIATDAVDATVSIPGSKSVTNRALILAAIADEASLLHGPLKARDTELMASALRALGTVIEDVEGAWAITPGPLRGAAHVDCGLAGTVMRFVPPLAGLADGDVAFDGDERSYARPMRPLIEALRALGVDIDGAALPFVVHGRGSVKGGTVSLDASTSSQFVSGLLLAAPRFEEGLEVRHVGEPVPSTPHLQMTVAMLRACGADVDDSVPDVWRVAPGRLRGGELTIEPDLSNAAPFLAAALVTGGRTTIPDWPTATTQAGDALRSLLTSMGATVTLNDDGLTVSGGAAIESVDVDLHEVGELAPTIAALAALARTPSRLRGIAHLRGHETDRLAALVNSLAALGGDVRETDDGLEIYPLPLHGGVFETYHDHRMATAGAILGLVVPGVRVVDIATTAKTLPDFVELWHRMLG